MGRRPGRRQGPGLRPSTPAGPAERWWRLGSAMARNGVAVAGVLALGWPASSLLVLYFADTLAGMTAVFTAVMFRFTGSDAAEGPWDTLHGFLSALAGGAFLAGVVGVPLGIPLIFVLGSSPWRAAVTDPTLAAGLGVIGLTTLVAAVRHWWAMAQGEAGEARVKRDFAILFTRWILVVIAIYPALGLLDGLAPRAVLGVLVLVYAAASVWSELDPQRFADLFPDRRAASR